MVRIKLSGLLAASAGFRDQAIQMPEGTTIQEALRILGLPVSGSWTLSSVNGKLRSKTYVLQDGDELRFFPVGGGG